MNFSSANLAVVACIFAALMPRAFAAETPTTNSESSDLFYANGFEGSAYRFAEITFNVFTTYHLASIPHEGVHAATAYAFGTKTKRFIVKPMLEAVEMDKPDDERSTADKTLTSLSAPTFTRYTVDLPRWIHQPESGTWWDRWGGTYWLVSYSTLWVTDIGSWAAFASNDQKSGWDFGNAARAVSQERRGQAVFLGSLTALLGVDAILHWDDITYNAGKMIGRSSTTQPGKKQGAEVHFLGNQVAIELNF